MQELPVVAGIHVGAALESLGDHPGQVTVDDRAACHEPESGEAADEEGEPLGFLLAARVGERQHQGRDDRHQSGAADQHQDHDDPPADRMVDHGLGFARAIHPPRRGRR